MSLVRGTLVGVVEIPMLSGECCRCGLCCATPDGFRCENLLVVGNLGAPDATVCAVYGTRTNGMAITMIRRKTGERRASTCYMDSLEERAAIVLKGLGKGCSLVPDRTAAGGREVVLNHG